MTTEIESRDNLIYKMRLLGGTSRVVAARFNVSIAEVDAVVDRKMVKIDNPYRMRAMALDLERLETMHARFLRDALGGDLAAGHLCLKIAERKAAMLGTDAPVRIDAVQLVQNVGPPQTSTDKIEAAFEALRLMKRDPADTNQDDPPSTH